MQTKMHLLNACYIYLSIKSLIYFIVVSIQSAGTVASPQNDLSIDQQAGSCCQRKSDPVTCFLDDLQDVSMYCQAASKYDINLVLSWCVIPKLGYMTTKAVAFSDDQINEWRQSCTLSYLGITVQSYHVTVRIYLWHFT